MDKRFTFYDTKIDKNSVKWVRWAFGDKTKKAPRFYTSGLLAVRRGLEPLTPCVTGTYSNQLN